MKVKTYSKKEIIPLALAITAIGLVAYLSMASSIKPKTTQPTTPGYSGPIKGDANTSTAEKRLLTDPNVLWMGTYDNSPDWKTNWNLQTLPTPASNFTTANAPVTSARGKSAKITHVGSSSQTNTRGALYWSYFDSPGTNMGLAPQDEIYLRYSVYFPANFECVGGGKLPGLGAHSDPNNRSRISSGGALYPYSASGRVIWRGAIPNVTTSCPISSYFYVPYMLGQTFLEYKANGTKPTASRVGFSQYWYENADAVAKKYLTAKLGSWNTIELYYKMNTVGQRNGIHKAWLNGVLGAQISDVEYRTVAYPNMKFNNFIPENFYGGSKGPLQTVYQYFDDFVLSKAPIGPRDVTAPSTPTNLTAKLDRNKVVLKWSASTDPDGNLTHYYIYRDGSYYAQVGSSLLTYTDESLIPPVKHTYTVTAVDVESNESAKSNQATVSVLELK